MKCKTGYKLENGKCVKNIKHFVNYESNSNSYNGGIGFFGVLTLIFITLKLTKVIDWSWWLVLAPIWIPIVLGLIILIIFYIAIWRKL